MWIQNGFTCRAIHVTKYERLYPALVVATRKTSTASSSFFGTAWANR